jgi:hypothetical protein
VQVVVAADRPRVGAGPGCPSHLALINTVMHVINAESGATNEFVGSDPTSSEPRLEPDTQDGLTKPGRSSLRWSVASLAALAWIAHLITLVASRPTPTQRVLGILMGVLVVLILWRWRKVL